MECIPACNPTSSAGSSSSSKANEMSKEKKGAAVVKKSKKGVMKLSTDPQSVAARERRHRISDRFKILRSMVPGGSKMDTASMLEEAIHYVEFLKTQIWLHQTMINFVYDESSMFLPHQDYFLPYDQIFSLQQNTSVSLDDSLQTLPQLLPLDQWCFQGEEEDITFDANMKYWPA